MPDVGIFRTLLFMYLVPFFISFFFLIYYVVAKYETINQGPFYMKYKQLAILTIISVAAIMFDYLSVFAYSAYSAS
jgi:hypothetical protein